MTEAIRQEVVAQGFWDNAEDEDKGVAPEPAALTDKVVKCAVLEVMEQRHLAAGDDAVAEDLDLTELPSAVAKHLGESDGGERLGKDFLDAMIEGMEDYLRRLKLKEIACRRRSPAGDPLPEQSAEPEEIAEPDQSAEPEQIAEPQLNAKQPMLSLEDIHKKFSALKKPRRAFALFARDKRPALEERGMSLGEIGAARRPAFLRATMSPSPRRLDARQDVELIDARAEGGLQGHGRVR